MGLLNTQKSLSLSKDANDNTSGGNKSDHVVTPQVMLGVELGKFKEYRYT